MLGTMLSPGDRTEGRTGPADHHESQRPVRDTGVISKEPDYTSKLRKSARSYRTM